jgi:sec-independent protein translocase protein TatB
VSRWRGYPGSVFDSIGWGEIVVLALAALFIFGPERLPNLAKDAATGLKKVREAITGVRAQVDESLGDDLAKLRDLDLRQYHPKTFLRNQLFADDDGPTARRGSATGSAGLAAAGGAVAARDAVRTRDAATPPPFDPDAT